MPRPVISQQGAGRPAHPAGGVYGRSTARVWRLDGLLGGVNTLSVVLVTIAATLISCGLTGQSLPATTLLVMLCFSALGAGNGAVFQLVPLRCPLATAVAGSMIGEIGALGGGLVPSNMGLAKQYAGRSAAK